MKRRELLLLLVVIGATAQLVRPKQAPSTPSPVPAATSSVPTTPQLSSGLRVCRVGLGMTRSEVESLLGPPDFVGSVPGKDDQQMAYVEYGNKVGTWNGRPTIVYSPENTVYSVIGDSLELEGRVACRLGQPYTDVKSSLPKLAYTDEVLTSDRYHTSICSENQVANLSFEQQHLSRITLVWDSNSLKTNGSDNPPKTRPLSAVRK